MKDWDSTYKIWVSMSIVFILWGLGQIHKDLEAIIMLLGNRPIVTLIILASFVM